MPKYLWIDDIRNRPADLDCDIARNCAQAVALLEANTYSSICIDHDLGDFDAAGNEKTGYDVLMYLAQQKMDGKTVPQHYELLTANPVGAEAEALQKLCDLLRFPDCTATHLRRLARCILRAESIGFSGHCLWRGETSRGR